jgi:hypothetical protein
VPKWQRGNAPKTGSVPRRHQAISPGPVETGAAKAGNANQQLSQLEHETGNTVTAPAKKAPKSSVRAPKSSDAAPSRRGMSFPYQPRKSAPPSARVQSATSNQKGK